jgi:hypothetical protein
MTLRGMGKVVLDISMSLDGFIAGRDDGPDQGLGKPHCLTRYMCILPPYCLQGGFVCLIISATNVSSLKLSGSSNLMGTPTLDIESSNK